MTTDREDVAERTGLPWSRQPVPGAEQYEKQQPDGHRGERRPRKSADIEAELQATAERMAANIDELAARLSPRGLAQRGLAGVRSAVLTPAGRPRAEAMGALVGGLAGVAMVVWRARRR